VSRLKCRFFSLIIYLIHWNPSVILICVIVWNFGIILNKYVKWSIVPSWEANSYSAENVRKSRLRHWIHRVDGICLTDRTKQSYSIYFGNDCTSPSVNDLDRRVIITNYLIFSINFLYSYADEEFKHLQWQFSSVRLPTQVVHLRMEIDPFSEMSSVVSNSKTMNMRTVNNIKAMDMCAISNSETTKVIFT
jgi:hypothetical protein